MERWRRALKLFKMLKLLNTIHHISISHKKHLHLINMEKAFYYVNIHFDRLNI